MKLNEKEKRELRKLLNKAWGKGPGIEIKADFPKWFIKQQQNKRYRGVTKILKEQEKEASHG